MSAAPLPEDEELRLRTLYSYRILDTVEEHAFDDICEIAAAVCATPTALFTLLDRRRQWFKARWNFATQETDRECSFCAHAINSGDLLVVDDAKQDGRFIDNRLVVSSPGIRFYAGTPVRAKNGQPLGTVCVIDYEPRKLSSDQASALKALARKVEAQLELRRLQSEKDLLDRFMIHDMRNPLTAMMMTASHALGSFDSGQLERDELIDLHETIDTLHRRVEDFHTLLESKGGNLPLKVESIDIHDMFGSLESALARPLADRNLSLETHIEADAIWGDRDLLCRVLENLLYNAIRVSPAKSTLRLAAWNDADTTCCRVTDEGPGIPEAQRQAIFEVGYSLPPQGSGRRSGLGLAFCAIATYAMGGSIACEDPSSGQGASFRVSLPRPTAA